MTDTDTLTGNIPVTVQPSETGHNWGITGEPIWPMPGTLKTISWSNSESSVVTGQAGRDWVVPKDHVVVDLKHGLLATISGQTVYVVRGQWPEDVYFDQHRAAFYAYVIEPATVPVVVQEISLSDTYSAANVESLVLLLPGTDKRGEIEEAILQFRRRQGPQPGTGSPNPVKVESTFKRNAKAKVLANPYFTTVSGERRSHEMIQAGENVTVRSDRPDNEGDYLVQKEDGRNWYLAGDCMEAVGGETAAEFKFKMGDQAEVLSDPYYTASGKRSLLVTLEPGTIVNVRRDEADGAGDWLVVDPQGTHYYIAEDRLALYLGETTQKADAVAEPDQWTTEQGKVDHWKGLAEEASERATRLEIEVRATRDRADLSQRQHQALRERMDDFEKAAHERADDQGWCSDYDDFMEEHGFDRRTREYDVEMNVTVRVNVTVEASDDEEAEEKAIELAEEEVAQMGGDVQDSDMQDISRN